MRLSSKLVTGPFVALLLLTCAAGPSLPTAAAPLSQIPCTVIRLTNDTLGPVYVWTSVGWLGRVPAKHSATLYGCGAHTGATPFVWVLSDAYGVQPIRATLGPHLGVGPYRVHIADPYGLDPLRHT